MPKASQSTTPPHPISVTGRRQIFGASAALLVAGVTEARVAQATEPDGELLRLVAELEALHTRAVGPETQADDKAFAALMGEYWDVADEIGDLVARTSDGLLAKARALRSVWRCLDGDPHGNLGHQLESLLQNMLGDSINGTARA